MISLSHFSSTLFKGAPTELNAQPEDSTGAMVLQIKDINTSGGQCTWCGRYGHNRGYCPLLK